MSDNGSETPVVDNVEVEETQVQEAEAPKGKMSVEVSLTPSIPSSHSLTIPANQATPE